MSEKIKVGISIGDVNGIGMEVIIKTLSDAMMMNYCTPIVYGNTKIASYNRKNLGLHDFSFNVINAPEEANPKKPNLINCWEEDVKITFGEANEIGGKYAFISLEKATNDLIEGKIDALVTAPINKHNIQSEQFNFPGHTEYLQERCGGADSLMFLVSDEMRVGVVTGHIPVSHISEKITVANIMSKLNLMNQSLKQDFWIRKPRIAILGLNPHAGDNGLIGIEEQLTIIPAIAHANAEGILAAGPFPADGFFGNGTYKNFDAVLAMYHDQGLIPFKNTVFDLGVNFTAGLNKVRTSPDHGTGYGIAGKKPSFANIFSRSDVYSNSCGKKPGRIGRISKKPAKI